MNDVDIIELIRKGKSSSALNVLYHNFPAIRKMIVANGGTVIDAEDIFQESLIILVRKIRNTDFKLTSQLNTYLFSVCRFVWSDELKKRRRDVTEDLATILGDIEQRELEEAVSFESRAKLAEKVLNELKERCRELLLFFYIEKARLQDIAIKMGYNSENTAKNQKYKCLEAAKNRLRELEKITPLS